MTTGVITKVHDDRSGFVREQTGARYRFYPNHLWNFADAAPKAGDEVVFEANSTGRSVKGMRRLKAPGIGIVSEQRWLPARITGKGVATNRYASTLYLTLAQMAATRVPLGAIVLVRQRHTYQRLAEALELKLAPAEEAAKMAEALQAIGADAAEGLRAADTQLLALEPLETAEQLVMAIRLLQLRDAYSSAPGKPVLEAVPEVAKQLQTLGYANWLSDGAMFGLRLAEEPNLRADQLMGGLFDRYVVKRLTELGAIRTDEECQEILELHRLSKQKGSKVFTAELLNNLELELGEACQLGLWQQGLDIALPHTRLNPTLLPIVLFERYARQRLTELNPIETIEGEQELLRLVELSQQKHSTIFSADLLASLSMSEACQVALWKQGAKVELPHTRLDPSLLKGKMLDQYVRQRIVELNLIATDEACKEVLGLYQLCKQQNLEVFTSAFLKGVKMDEAYQLEMWRAGMAVALPHTRLDPHTLSSLQLEDYLRRRIAELNPIETAAAAQELLMLYELVRRKQATHLFMMLMEQVSVAEAHRLPLWLAGIDVAMPSIEELAQLVIRRLAPGHDSSEPYQLMARLERQRVAAAVLGLVIAHTADEDLPQMLVELQHPRMPAAHGAYLAAILEGRCAEQQLLQWWLDGTLRVAPVRAAARQVLQLEGEEQRLLLRKLQQQQNSVLGMVEELRQQMHSGALAPAAALLLERQVAIVQAQGRSRWQVDHWAERLVRDLADSVVRLPNREQLDWWLRGLGNEPATAVLYLVAPVLPDDVLSRMWRSISTPGAKTLVQALLPGLAWHGTGRWVLVTLKELVARRGVFYTQACQNIIAQVLPYQTAAEQVNLWLSGFIGQPSDETLWPLMEAGAETIIPLLRRLPADSLAQLLPACLAALTVESSQTQVVLEQLTKYEDGHAGCSNLKQRLLDQLLPSVPDSLYMEWWASGWVPAPPVEQLGRSLPGLTPELRQVLLRRCKVDSLVEYGNWVLNQPLVNAKLAEEVALQLHGAGAVSQDAAQLLDALLRALQPEAHVLGWLNGKLPDPSATTLEGAMGGMEAALCQMALDRCSVTLLAGYGQLLLKKPELEESSVRPLAMRLQGFSNDAGAQRLVLDLLAQVSPATQLRWWLDAEVQIDWKLIRLGLEQKDTVLQLEVAHAAAARHMSELLRYLPAAPAELLAQLVGVFTHQSSWYWHGSAAERGQAILVLTEQLCLRFGHEPDLLQGYLYRMRKHCMSIKWTSSNSRNETFANGAIVELLVEELVGPTLTVEQLLTYWQDGLLGYFPLVPLSAIANMVASTLKERWYPRLHTAAGIPAAVPFAWEGLSSLVGQPMESLEEVAAAYSSTLEHIDLLWGIVPWLELRLDAAQIERLWMWGYPVAEPKDWATLTMLERLFTAIRFSRLNRDAELPPNFLPTAGEISEWLDDQYWDAEQQQSAGEAFKLLKRYHTLALIKLSDWAEVEDQLLLRCEAVVKVRLWLNQPGLDRERTFNYYSFRRGYSRLSTEEQRAFLRAAHHHLKSSFTKALHLKRRRLVGIKDGVSEYRVSVAHCYCPQEGYLEIELADNLHTQPFAYPGAKVEWNENLLKMPWAGCPVFAHVDGQSRELLQLKGLEAALARPSNKRDGEIDYTFNPEKRDTTGNPIAYPQDELLHDELTEYLTKRADDVEQRYVLIEEARVKREHRTPSANAEAEVHDGGSDDAADFNGVILQPRQTVIYLVPQKEEVVFVWASRFANSNKATYLFRAPAQEQHEALERLKTVLQGVGRIRSALLAPGRATHRLRRHLGYVTNIRGRRGHAEAFKLWQSRFDQALEDGPSTEHPYAPASDWQMSELETPTATSPKPINPTTVARASQMLERLRLLNLTFLSQYAA